MMIPCPFFVWTKRRRLHPFFPPLSSERAKEHTKARKQLKGKHRALFRTVQVNVIWILGDDELLIDNYTLLPNYISATSISNFITTWAENEFHGFPFSRTCLTSKKEVLSLFRNYLANISWLNIYARLYEIYMKFIYGPVHMFNSPSRFESVNSFFFAFYFGYPYSFTFIFFTPLGSRSRSFSANTGGCGWATAL